MNLKTSVPGQSLGGNENGAGTTGHKSKPQTTLISRIFRFALIHPWDLWNPWLLFFARVFPESDGLQPRSGVAARKVIMKVRSRHLWFKQLLVLGLLQGRTQGWEADEMKVICDC